MAGLESYELQYKIVLSGDSGVGKSNLFSRFHKNEFSLESGATLGVEFATKPVEFENTIIKAQIWDTCGQEQFRALTKTYYRRAAGAIIVYDVTRKNSFASVERWYNDIKETVDEECVIMLVGNKTDLKNIREVDIHTAAVYAKSKNMAFIETSALDSTNVENAFDMIIKEIYSTTETLRTQHTMNKALGEGETIVITDNSQVGNKGGKQRKGKTARCC